MKGIVLAGGSGTRLHPLTHAVSKQILPVYNKPMIYYPLSLLMQGGIRDILVISTPNHLELFRALLGDGSRLGINIDYAEQPTANGIAEAFLIGEKHVADDPVALVLGDNIFHGSGMPGVLRESIRDVAGCTLFGAAVEDPERYGVGEVDASGNLLSIEEKPKRPRSNLAVTGLYLYSNDVVDIARDVRPSPRGEREITDVNKIYLGMGRARFVDLGPDITWIDTGTHESLFEAGRYVRLLEQGQGVRIACLEEIAFRSGFIDAETCFGLGVDMGGSDYGQYLMEISSK